jgi:hypothetical protein
MRPIRNQGKRLSNVFVTDGRQSRNCGLEGTVELMQTSYFFRRTDKGRSLSDSLTQIRAPAGWRQGIGFRSRPTSSRIHAKVSVLPLSTVISHAPSFSFESTYVNFVANWKR